MSDPETTHVERLSCVEAVERSLESASHLTEIDSAAIAALRALAVKMDRLAADGFLVDGRVDPVPLRRS